MNVVFLRTERAAFQHSAVRVYEGLEESIMSVLRKGTKMVFMCNDLHCAGGVSRCGSLCAKKE
jgi:ribosomal protein L7Ae-like RNA K-turn-binding protein